MDWYYAIGDEQRGPVDEAALREMLASGEIAPDALVWNDTMPDWLPATTVLPTVPPSADATGGSPLPPATLPAATSTKFQRAFFILLLLRPLLFFLFRLVPGIALLVGLWIFDAIFLLTVALAILALREQRPPKHPHLTLCVALPLAFLVLFYTLNFLTLRGGLAFEQGIPLWFYIYISFGYLSTLLDFLLALYGLKLLRR